MSNLLKGFSFFSNEGHRTYKPYISADRLGRVYLSEGAKELMNIKNEELPVALYLGYDKVNKRIGLARPEVVRLVDVKPFKFNGERTYASARSFLLANNILPKEGVNRYIFVGKEEGIFVFQLEDYEAPDAKFQPKKDKEEE